MAAPAPAAALVDRDAELALLAGLVAGAREGRGEVALLTGEAGIGKTRLARAVLEHAREAGAATAWGAAWAAGGAPPFWPWIQVLRGLAERLGADALRALAPPAPHPLGRLLPELGPAAPGEALDAAETRFALFDGVVQVLRGLAREAGPLVLVLDDLHAADPGTLLLLDLAARSLPDGRVLVVGAARDEAPADPAGAEALARVRAAAREVALRGLGRDGVAALVAARGVRGGGGPAALSRRLHVLTDGNPLFVQESLRLLDDAAPGADVVDLPLPAELRETVRRRLAGLDPDVRAVLEVAAVAGREPSAAVVAAAAQRPPAEVLAALDAAAAHAVVRPAARRPGHFAFTHEVVRRALADELGTAARAALHRAVALALEAGGAAGTPAAEVAHHWLAAVPAGEADRAVDAAAAAAHEALSGLAYEQAEELLGAALDTLALLPADEPRRLALLLGLGTARVQAGRVDEGRRALAEAAGLARRLGDPDAQARAALAAAPWGLSVTVDDVELLGLLREALAAGDHPPAVRARLVGALAAAGYWALEGPERLRLVEEAIGLAREAGDPQTLARVLADAHVATWDPDSVGRSPAWAAEIEALGPAIGPELGLYAATWRISLGLEQGDLAGARRAITAFARDAEATRLPRARRSAARHAALLALLEGRAEDVERVLAEGGAELREGSVDTLLAAAQGFVLRWGQGRLAELLDGVRHFAAAQPQLPVWRCALAAALLQAGRRDEAADELDGLLGTLPRDNLLLACAVLLADVAEATGDREAAAALEAVLAPFEGRWVVVADAAVLGPVARATGRLRTVLGDPDAGLAALAAARRQAAAAGAGVVLAHLHVDEARARLARGAPGDAETASGLLAEATRAGERLGLVGVVAAAAHLAAATSGPPAGPGATEGPEVAPGGGAVAGARTSGPLLERVGQGWHVVHAGHDFLVRDVRGLHHLARLLADPEAEVPALELAGAAGAPDDAGSGPLLDAQAKAAYGARLADLEDELEEAERFGDGERAARARAERQALAHELAAAVGLGGRDRRTGASAERARVNVTRAIRSAIERLAAEDPALGRHLDLAVRTGTFCAYRPEPGAPAWVVRP